MMSEPRMHRQITLPYGSAFGHTAQSDDVRPFESYGRAMDGDESYRPKLAIMLLVLLVLTIGLPLLTQALPMLLFVCLSLRRDPFWKASQLARNLVLILWSLLPGLVLVAWQHKSIVLEAGFPSLMDRELSRAIIRAFIAGIVLSLMQMIIPGRIWFQLLQNRFVPSLLFSLGLSTWNWIRQVGRFQRNYRLAARARFRKLPLSKRRQMVTWMVARLGLEALSEAKHAEYARLARRLPLPFPQIPSGGLLSRRPWEWVEVSSPLLLPLLYGFLL
jgi:hypothetical protein